MEDTLRAYIIAGVKADNENVLILILMEDTLRVVVDDCFWVIDRGLNPYSNGRYSTRLWTIRAMTTKQLCLNPYSNGRYSTRGI